MGPYLPSMEGALLFTRQALHSFLLVVTNGMKIRKVDFICSLPPDHRWMVTGTASGTAPNLLPRTTPSGYFRANPNAPDWPPPAALRRSTVLHWLPACRKALLLPISLIRIVLRLCEITNENTIPCYLQFLYRPGWRRRSGVLQCGRILCVFERDFPTTARTRSATLWMQRCQCSVFHRILPDTFSLNSFSFIQFFIKNNKYLCHR